MYCLHNMLYNLECKSKKNKLDASGESNSTNSNIAEIHNQALMMLGHEIFDPEVSRKVLIDHAYIISGGEITKQARNWLGGKLDCTQRSQILFMDRSDITNLFVTTNLSVPGNTLSELEAIFDFDEDAPF